MEFISKLCKYPALWDVLISVRMCEWNSWKAEGFLSPSRERLEFGAPRCEKAELGFWRCSLSAHLWFGTGRPSPGGLGPSPLKCRCNKGLKAQAWLSRAALSCSCVRLWKAQLPPSNTQIHSLNWFGAIL